MKTKKPSAIVYGWRELGTFTLTSDVYFEENLEEEKKMKDERSSGESSNKSLDLMKKLNDYLKY